MDKIDAQMLEGLTLEQKAMLLHEQVNAMKQTAIAKIITETIMFLGILVTVLLLVRAF